MATMLDVAKKSGVSLSTVSYVLSGIRPVSEETKRRVFATMEELGYQPHALARGLASRRSRIIGLLLPSTERGLGLAELDFVTCAVEAAAGRDYSLVLWTAEMSDPEQLRALVRQSLVDGMILMEVHERDARVDALRELDMPFSMIGRCADCDGIPYADTDFAATMAETVKYLASLGHRRLGFVNQSKAVYDSGYGPAVKCQEGFFAAAEAAGVSAASVFCRPSPKDGRGALASLLREDPGISALVAMNDRALPGLLWEAEERGLSLPRDLSLVSAVSSARVAEMFKPALTTMEQSGAELGRLSVSYLIDLLEGVDSGRPHALLPCKLVIRESSGTARDAVPASVVSSSAAALPIRRRATSALRNSSR
jgi:Transcriptional regulators